MEEKELFNTLHSSNDPMVSKEDYKSIKKPLETTFFWNHPPKPISPLSLPNYPWIGLIRDITNNVTYCYADHGISSVFLSNIQAMAHQHQTLSPCTSPRPSRTHSLNDSFIYLCNHIRSAFYELVEKYYHKTQRIRQFYHYANCYLQQQREAERINDKGAHDSHFRIHPGFTTYNRDNEHIVHHPSTMMTHDLPYHYPLSHETTLYYDNPIALHHIDPITSSKTPSYEDISHPDPHPDDWLTTDHITTLLSLGAWKYAADTIHTGETLLSILCQSEVQDYVTRLPGTQSPYYPSTTPQCLPLCLDIGIKIDQINVVDQQYISDGTMHASSIDNNGISTFIHCMMQAPYNIKYLSAYLDISQSHYYSNDNPNSALPDSAVNYLNDLGQNSLHTVCSYALSLYRLCNNASPVIYPLSVSPMSSNPVSRSVQHPLFRLISLLFRHNVNVNARDKRGFTPVYALMEANRHDCRVLSTGSRVTRPASASPSCDLASCVKSAQSCATFYRNTFQDHKARALSQSGSISAHLLFFIIKYSTVDPLLVSPSNETLLDYLYPNHSIVLDNFIDLVVALIDMGVDPHHKSRNLPHLSWSERIRDGAQDGDTTISLVYQLLKDRGLC